MYKYSGVANVYVNLPAFYVLKKLTYGQSGLGADGCAPRQKDLHRVISLLKIVIYLRCVRSNQTVPW